MEFPNHIWVYIPGSPMRARAPCNHVVVMLAADWLRSEIWGFPTWSNMASIVRKYGIREGKTGIPILMLTNKALKYICNN